MDPRIKATKQVYIFIAIDLSNLMTNSLLIGPSLLNIHVNNVVSTCSAMSKSRVLSVGE